MVSALRSQDQFTEITVGPVAATPSTTVVAWGDFNGDGYPDLYLGTNNGAGSLFQNNRDGTFTRVANSPISTDFGATYGAAWADYNNDGNLDLFVGVNQTSNVVTTLPNWLYENRGNGVFNKDTTDPVVGSGGTSNNCSWIDYDRDGFLDLFIADGVNGNLLYHNNGNGTFSRVTNSLITSAVGNSQGGAWADYDNDGKTDLFVSRVNLPPLLYHNEGNGVFTLATSGAMAQSIAGGQGTSWGDYDNDGYPDLFVVNSGAPNLLFHNNGNGTFTRVTSGPIVSDIGSGHGCAWEDYDNDGYLDLIVVNRNGPNFLYHNNGDGTFTRVMNSIVGTESADGWAAAWADYDNDGFVDLVVSEFSGFGTRVFHNNGNANNWVTIKCVGTVSNVSAIGAKVRVHATIGGKAMWQMREISGGDGLGTQNDMRAHFGLGDATIVDTIRVEWPSGIVQTMTSVASRQFVTVTEPSSPSPTIETQPANQFAVSGGSAIFSVVAAGPPGLSYQWNFNGSAIIGATSPTLTLVDVQSSNAGTYSVTVSDAFGSVNSSPVTLSVSAPGTSTARLTNISTRAQVGTGSNILIPGFVIVGGGTETLLIRADGPGLTQFNVPGVLAHPSLSVFNSLGAVVASNTGWSTNSDPALVASTAASVGAFALAPGSADSALIVRLQAGTYTVQVSGVENTTGVALAEVYEVSSGGTRLTNVSTRIQAGTGGNIIITGFAIAGTGAETLLVRGDGPSLAQFNLTGVLAQPSLTLIDQNSGDPIASNTGWSSSADPAQIANAAASVGAFSINAASADSAVVVDLPPGSYTAEVSGVNNGTGVALVEVYEIQ